MRLPSLTETLESVAAAAVDLVAHKVDAMQGLNKPFQNVTDIYRLALTLGSMAYYSYSGDPKALPLYDVGVAFLTESVAYAVGKQINVKIPGAPTADPVDYTFSSAPKRIVPPAAPAPQVSSVNIV